MSKEYTVFGSVTLMLNRPISVIADSNEDALDLAVEVAREQGEVLNLGLVAQKAT